ncbi:MAG: hypothetical protein Q4B71_06225 [Cardiobacteriaceae bacterium]|nr:hypothetical protein [Cardiobacteriaceae bacterium]
MHIITSADISALFQDYSIEVTPKTLAKLGNLNLYLPKGKRVFVTFLANAELEDTLWACEQLEQQGYIAVPHLAARHLRSEQDWLRALRYVREHSGEALFLAGGGDHIRGAYRDTFDFMNQSALAEAGLARYIFAGHPEGNGDVGAQAVALAEERKWQWAQQHGVKSALMTQFVFQATPVVAWAKRLEERGLHFPLYIGIPGVAGLGALIKHAQLCGIGVSMGFLLKQRAKMMNMLSLQKPNHLIYQLALAKKQGLLPHFSRLHFYPLGGLVETVHWIQAIEQGQFEVSDKGLITYD